MAPRRMLFASFLFAAACASAYADQPLAGPARPLHVALAIAPAKIRAPYDVQIMREDGRTLPTYQLRDRFYVQGSANERYIIRITNPTEHRIEAVVSVDGLDVIDGENGDLRKRGYIVPPYGETRIEGFRTSRADVATFRFSSVAGSYAGQKGKARNVGVIAVALFEELELVYKPQEIIVGQGAAPPRRRAYHDRDDRAPSADTAGAPGPSRAESKAEAAPATSSAPQAPMPPTRGAGGRAPLSDGYADDEAVAARPERSPRERLGLGTEFGEQRSSAVFYTRFVRAPGRPVAIAELRYNDAAGLLALGIPVAPLPDGVELTTRESADPFPGDRFAQPPR